MGGQRIARGFPQIQKDRRESQKPGRVYQRPRNLRASLNRWEVRESLGVPHRFRKTAENRRSQAGCISGPKSAGLFESVGDQRIARGFHRFRKTAENRRSQAGVSAAPKSAGLFESVGDQRIERGSHRFRKTAENRRSQAGGISGPEICGPL